MTDPLNHLAIQAAMVLLIAGTSYCIGFVAGRRRERRAKRETEV